MASTSQAVQIDGALLSIILKAVSDSCDVAMHNTAAARIPECGDFAGIAQNLDWIRVQLAEVVNASSCVEKVGVLDSETIRLATVALKEMPSFSATNWQDAAKHVCKAVSAIN